MSRRKTLPSFNSSRQMMMAWKVSGLSQRPAIIASRPASMRLAMAISPSRESSSTEPISRRYMRTGSSVRSEGSFFSVVASDFGFASTTSVPVSSSSSSASSALALSSSVSVSSLLHDVDAHLRDHGEDVFDLVGGDLLGRQHGVDLVVGDVAALFRGLDHLLDAGIVEIEQRLGIRGAFGVLVRGLFLDLRLSLRRHLDRSPFADRWRG